MVISRLFFDVALVILLITIITAFVFSLRSWVKYRQQKFFWYLLIMGSYLLMVSGIVINNYLKLANDSFAEGSLGLFLDDQYWILVAAFLKILLIAVMIYGTNRICVHLIPIALKGKKRLFSFLIMILIALMLIFFIIIRLEYSGPLFSDAAAVANGLLFPIGCLAAGIQAVSILIPSLAMQKKNNRKENYFSLVIFIPFIVLPIIDFIWFVGGEMQSYIRVSYFSIILLLTMQFKLRSDPAEKGSDSLIENNDKLEKICRKFEISERERDVLRLIIAGNNHQSIADELFISINTVKSHLQSIYKKMRVSSKIQLLLKINSIN